MKRIIYCPRCAEGGKRPKMLGECEDIMGSGTLFLWCKRCGRAVRVDLRKYSVSQ